MKVLGIDPGIERLGWAIVEKTINGEYIRINSGVQKTLKTKNTSQRLLEILNFLERLIQKEKPDAASIEKLFFAKNAKTAMVIGEVRGVVLAIMEKYHLPIKEFAPTEVKMAICGYGRAGKKDMVSMLHLSIALPSENLLDDETDAIALALTMLVSQKSL